MSGFNDYEAVSPKKRYTGKRWKKLGPKEVNARIDAKIKEAMKPLYRYLYGHLGGGDNDTE